MSKDGVDVSKTTVAEWIRDAGLAPANRQLRKGDWPRREAVIATCGHPVAAPPVNEPTRRVLCFQCGWVKVRQRDRRELMADAEARKPIAMPTVPTAPDTTPTAGEHELHFVDCRVSTVARDLLDRIPTVRAGGAFARRIAEGGTQRRGNRPRARCTPSRIAKEWSSASTSKVAPMVSVKITKFTGTGELIVVVGQPQLDEPQAVPKPVLRLIRGGAS